MNCPIHWIEIYPVARENDHSLLPAESVNRPSNNWALTSEIHTRFHIRRQLFERFRWWGGGGGREAILRGPVPEKPISTNPGLKVCSFLLFFPSYVLLREKLCLVTVSWSRAKKYFVSSSCMFLDEKTLLKLWLNSRVKLNHRINHYPLDSAIDFPA